MRMLSLCSQEAGFTAMKVLCGWYLLPGTCQSSRGCVLSPGACLHVYFGSVICCVGWDLRVLESILMPACKVAFADFFATVLSTSGT
jgi:hypothetical protein